MPEKILTSTAFCPPIWYAACSAQCDSVSLEAKENYQKRSVRNRCFIQSSQGPLLLSVPLAKGKNEQCPIQYVLKRTDDRWLRETKKSLQSSYTHAPFYEHYQAPLFDLLQEFSGEETLWSGNLLLLKGLWKMIGIESKFFFTQGYTKATDIEAPMVDLRRASIRFARTSIENIPAYDQVFTEQQGFQADLSVLDLIMEKGPASLEYLQQYPLNL